MQKQSECGTLGNLEDNNWDVKYSGQYNYVLKTGSGASDLIGQRSWIKEKLDSSLIPAEEQGKLQILQLSIDDMLFTRGKGVAS